MAKKNLYLCIDRVIPAHLKLIALERSIAVRADNRPKLTPKLVAQLNMAPNPALRMAMERGKYWQIGQQLKCRFLDGSKSQKSRVEAISREWEQYTTVKLKFVKTGPAEIRISFVADSGSWSAVGNDALVAEYFGKTAPTMNYGWLRDDTDEDEYRRVVLHEFGHTLGAIHEHQSPGAGGLKWDKAAVYKAFSGPPNNWSKADIDQNILDRYSRSQTNFTNFDPKSIMLYGFPPELFTDHKGTSSNGELSSTDKKFMKSQYKKT
jgi:hypothetical protein